jgi:Flp pilus assembly protein TadG
MRSPMVCLVAVSRAMRRFRRNRRGSTAVEFALIAPFFFALIFAILETAMVFFAGQILEIGTQDSARLIFTNQAQAARMDSGQFRDNLCGRVSVLMDCTKLVVDVKAYPQGTAIPSADLADPITSGGGGTFDNSKIAYQSSGPGDTVLVRAFYQWPLFVTQIGYNIANLGRNYSSSYRLLTATAAFRVEPGP